MMRLAQLRFLSLGWRRRYAVLFALILPHLIGAVSAATLKPPPSGIYDLVFDPSHNGGFDLSINPVLDNPNVDGYRLRIGWGSIQPNNGNEYDWATIDSAIAIAAAHGKKVCISVAAGLWTPDWIYTSAPVVYKYAMKENDPLTGLSVGNQPLPWDTAYLQKWTQFLSAFGARYDSNPALSYVVMGGFMETFNMYLAGIAEDATAIKNLAVNPPPGYPGLVVSYPDFSSAYTSAAQGVIGFYVTNFPTTSLLLTLTPVTPDDEGVSLQNSLVSWGKSTYPVQFGTMVSALFATMPPHNPPPPPLSFPKGFQLLCRAIDNAAWLYADPDPVPMPAAPQPLQDALEHGVSLAAQFIEVYEGDLTLAESQPVLAVEQAKLKANVKVSQDPPPVPPLPPTGLRVL